VAAIPETKYARAGDAHIAYQVFGQGETDLVWMPHWATHLELLWEDPLSAAFFQGLASFSRVMMFDKRGVGLSDPVALAAPLTVESWTEDLSAVLDAVGSQRAVVAASDMAGFIGVLFAATHPDRTTALVLVNATARVRRAPDYPIGLPDHLAEWLVAAYDDGWGAAAPTLGIMDPSVADNEGYLAWVSRYQRATASPGTIGPMVRMVLDTDVRGVLPASRVPTLVLHRADDAYVRADHGRYLADHIPGARYVELPGADHTPELGDADAIVAQMQSFLTGDWPITAPDRVLTTVVFTDIVGSTARAAELGDRRWKELLDAYDNFVLRQLDRFRGRQVRALGMELSPQSTARDAPLLARLPSGRESVPSDLRFEPGSMPARWSYMEKIWLGSLYISPSASAHPPNLARSLSPEPSSISWRAPALRSKTEVNTNSRACRGPGLYSP
jgi:pimeloyl-ACP methyl ester carboxylesterase